jgi:hypothetical protein
MFRPGSNPPLLFLLLLLASSLSRLSAQNPSSLSPEQPNHLRGIVLNSINHEPIPHALVLSPDHRYATMADDRGQFEFTLPPARVNTSPAITAFSPGSTQRSSPVLNRPLALTARKPGFLDTDAEQVPIAPDQTEVTLSLTPEARIIGQVTISGAKAADKINVSLYRRDIQSGRQRWDEAANVRTRSNGEFRFANLRAGDYKLFTQEHMDLDPLTWDPRGQLFGYSPVYYPAAADFDSAAVIHLSGAETLQASLTPSRREYYGVKLTLTNAPPGLQSQVEVWPQGRPGPGYTLGHNRDGSIGGSLPNGSYTVRLRSFGLATMTGMTNLTVSGAPALGSVALIPGTTVSVLVREEMQPRPEGFGGSFSNGMTGESFAIHPQRPTYLSIVLVPASQSDTAMDVGPRPPMGPDDTSLLFENVWPGQYHVRAQTALGYVASIVSGNTDLLRESLVVAPGSTPEPIEVTVRDDGAEIAGTIADAAQQPAESTPGQSFTLQSGPRAFFYKTSRRGHYAASQVPVVYAIPAVRGIGQFATAYVGSDGKFQLKQLAPGSYRLLAFDRPHPEIEFASEDELRRYDSQAKPIEVNAGDKRTQQLDFASNPE